MNRKIFMITLFSLVVLVPMLFGADNSLSDSEAIQYDPDAKINLNPTTGPPHIDDGRALGDILMTIDLTSIGMPGDGYDNAGISWDGSYVYLVSMFDNKTYVIDPTGPSIDTSWNAPAGLAWGCGHEQNLWITEYNTKNCYEYTYAGSPTGNVFYALQGGASWMGDVSEWWPDGEIWIIAVGGTNRAYKFSVPAGTYLDDIGDAAWTYTSQRGLTYDPYNNTFWLGGWNSDMVWEVDAATGAVLRQFPFMDIASLAYDWQSSLHPTPVLWLATNSATNTLYMIDADNPNPVQLFTWDFETGWQGWTHTNGMSYPAGWDVQPSGTIENLPDEGDSSMTIDSDAGGSGFWIQDSALSPVCVPIAPMDWLKYGFYNYGGGGSWLNELHVGIRYFTGGVWSVDELAFYPSGEEWGPGWDSVDVTAYESADRIQIYFYFDDLNTWGYWACFDNVSINVEIYVASHDVGTIAIVLPGDSIMPDSSVYPTATYSNFETETDTFEIHFDIDTGGVFLYQETQTMVLAAGMDSTYTFPTLWTAGPGEGVIYDLTAYTILGTDINPANDTVTSTTIAVGVAEEPGKLSPLVFGLSQNIPNPARNGYTAISYTTTRKGPVSLKIYDITGRLVRTLRDMANDRAGSRTVYWDMKDNDHNPVASGVYFYRLSANGKTATKKMVIVK